MPATDTGEYPFLVAEMLYVSGARVKNVKWPEASDLAVAVSDADEATTSASATGLPVVLSVILPLTDPVVPASVHVAWQSIAIVSARTNSGLKKRKCFKSGRPFKDGKYRTLQRVQHSAAVLRKSRDFDLRFGRDTAV
jgi:hypothetical protein